MTHGSATIDQSGNVLTINQGTDRLIMGWNSFSIGQGETTRFVQPSSSSMALNRVYGGTRSMIEGRLEANGCVILVNPAGITVTKSGVVNVNTFIGSTHDITDDEFLKGGVLNFKGASDASVENLGTIRAETGDIALIARTVRNEGTLSAPKGVVGLAAGDEVLYQPNAEERLLVKSQAASAASIQHSGSIQAAAAEIKAAGNPYAVAINLDGIIETHGHAATGTKAKVVVQANQGDIRMGSGAKVDVSGGTGGGFASIQTPGNLEIGGVILATSSAGVGGEIRLLGDAIHLDCTTVADASGFAGGGKIFVGGDCQGGANPTNRYASEPLPNASTLRIDKGAIMNAEATAHGDGGVVINWADGTTVSSGSVSVRGGPLGGNGGFVEISGKENLGFDGTVEVGARRGKAGIVLFDPAQIQITSATDLSAYRVIGIVTNQISYGDYLDGNVWVMSQSFFTDFTSGTIILQAYNISLEDPYGNNRANIVLKPDVNLVLESKAGDRQAKIFLPSGTETDGTRTWGDSTRSSITASGTGYVKLDASQGSELIIHGDITTSAGDIILTAQNGIDLARAALKSTNGGAVNITSSTGNIILDGSQIEGISGAIQITSSNGCFASTYSAISNAAGPISIIGQTGFNLTGASIQSTAGDIAVSSPSGNITMYSYAPGGVETNRIGSSIQSGTGSITLVSQNEIYLGGSTITTTGTNGGAVSLASEGSFIKLYSDAVGGTTTLLTSAIQSVGGNISLKGSQDANGSYVGDPALYNFAVTIDGACLSSETGTINITSTAGGIWLYYGSLSSATRIQTGRGNINLTGANSVDLYGALLKSTNGGSVSLSAPTSSLRLYNSQIQTTGGDMAINAYVNYSYCSQILTATGGISINADYNQLTYSQIQSDAGRINVSSGSYTYLEDPSSFIKSSASGDAVVISSTQYFYNGAGTNALQAPNGRWVVYLPSPQYLGNWTEPLNSGNDAIWNTPAGTPLAADKTGNRYVFQTAPYAQLTMMNASKSYGQNWSPVQGRDYTLAAPNSSGAFTMASSDLDFRHVTVTLSSLGYDAKASVGAYPVNFVSSANSNITVAPGSSASLTVTPATLTVGLTNVSKVYDGTTVAALGGDNFVLSGLVNGDKMTLLNTPSTGVYATGGAGSRIAVTASAPAKLALMGPAATNYTLNTDGFSGYGTIVPATLTASLSGIVSKPYDGSAAATLTAANYVLGGVLGSDQVGLNNPSSGSYDSAAAGTGKRVRVAGLELTGEAAANYMLASTTIIGSIGTILPAPMPNLSAAQLIAAEPTVQNALQSLTIRNTTVTASSGGSFGSAGPGSDGTGSGGESASAGETVSSGESSASASGGETASTASAGESGSSSETSTSSADPGSSTGSTAASAAASSSSAGSSTAGSSSSPSTGGSVPPSSGGSSQGAKAQATAISRMNNPVGGATVGGAEFQRLNPFSDAGAMHEEVASAAPSAGGTTQAGTGRAAAVSVKSPEMTELAPMNDLNVLFMMF